MELVHGISTHFIQSKKFKTNKIVAFYRPLSLDTIAGRMLSASMLETANQMYPNFSRFEKTFSQSIRYRYVNQLFQKRAKSHCRIDIYLCS